MKTVLKRLMAVGAVTSAFMLTLVQSVSAQYTPPAAAELTAIQDSITAGTSNFVTYILGFIGVFVVIFFAKKIIGFVRGLLKMK